MLDFNGREKIKAHFKQKESNRFNEGKYARR